MIIWRRWVNAAIHPYNHTIMQYAIPFPFYTVLVELIIPGGLENLHSTTPRVLSSPPCFHTLQVFRTWLIFTEKNFTTSFIPSLCASGTELCHVKIGNIANSPNKVTRLAVYICCTVKGSLVPRLSRANEGKWGWRRRAWYPLLRACRRFSWNSKKLLYSCKRPLYYYVTAVVR